MEIAVNTIIMFKFTFFMVVVKLQTTTTASTLPPGTITGDGGNILNTSNFHTVSSQSPESTLGSGSRAPGLISTSSPNLNVQSGNTQLLASDGNVLGGKHSSVRRGFITVGLDLHSSSNTDEGFPSGKISYVDKCVIERSEQVGNCEDFFSLTGLWS